MSKMSDFDVFSLLNVRNVKLDLMVNEKTSKVKREICAEKNASKLLYGPPPPKKKKKACNSIQKILHFCKAVVLFITNTE